MWGVPLSFGACTSASTSWIPRSTPLLNPRDRRTPEPQTRKVLVPRKLNACSDPIRAVPGEGRSAVARLQGREVGPRAWGEVPTTQQGLRGPLTLRLAAWHTFRVSPGGASAGPDPSTPSDRARAAARRLSAHPGVAVTPRCAPLKPPAYALRTLPVGPKRLRPIP